MAIRKLPEGDVANAGASLADLVLASDDLEREPAPTPEWPQVDGLLFIQTLSGTDRDALDTLALEAGARSWTVMPNAMAHVLVRTIVDADGRLVFTRKQVEALGKKSGRAISRLFQHAMRLSSATAEAAAAEADDLKAAPSDGSGTD